MSGGFDPDKYVSGQAFDPDAYTAAPAKQYGAGETALMGVGQGLSLGFGDEMKAGWRSLFPKSMGGVDYKQERDRLRAEDAAARQQHPYIYGATEAVGSALPAAGLAVATGGTSMAPMLAKAALPLAAGQGALQGAGSSNANTAGGLVRDASIGGGLGAAGYGLGALLGSAGRGIAGWARGKATQAVARAGEKAAEEVATGISSARGALGGEVQKGQRIVENLRRLGPELSPEQQQLVNELEQRLTASTLESLPAQAGTIATKDAELAALKSGASEAFNSRKADLLSTDEMKRQTIARILRYGPVAAGTALGTAVGGPMGSAIGALAGAGTRPAIQSLRRLAKNPAVQNAVFSQLADAAESNPGMLLRQLLSRGAPALATQELVTP